MDRLCIIGENGRCKLAILLASMAKTLFKGFPTCRLTLVISFCGRTAHEYSALAGSVDSPARRFY
jgi:hypothetical protein